MTKKTKRILFAVIAVILIVAITAGFLYMRNTYLERIAKIQSDSQKQIGLLQSELESKKITAYVPINDIKSGEVITPDMLEESTIFTDQPAEVYLDINSLILGGENLVEYDENAEYTDTDEAYTSPDEDSFNSLDQEEQDEQETVEPSDVVGMEVREQVLVSSSLEETDVPAESVDGTANEPEEISAEDLETIEDEATSSEEETSANTREPELSNVIAITDLPAGQPIFKSSVTIMDCTGLMEKFINFVTLNTNLLEGDTIDIRIIFPNGEDYIVTTKQVLRNFNLAAGEFYLWMTEEEITRLSAATVDANINGAELYVTRYIKPSVQDENIATYQPNADVMALMDSDPNIITYSEGALSLTARRNLETRLKLFEEENSDSVSNVSETETGSN